MAVKGSVKKTTTRRRDRKNIDKGAAHIHSSFNNTSGQKNDASQKLKDIDAETLIIAQAISKRKGNPKN